IRPGSSSSGSTPKRFSVCWRCAGGTGRSPGSPATSPPYQVPTSRRWKRRGDRGERGSAGIDSGLAGRLSNLLGAPAGMPRLREWRNMMTNPTIDLLLRRRSVTAIKMSEPGPDRSEINLILRVGARVPDHGKLAPWRFVLFEGPARAQIGKTIGKAFRQRYSDADAERTAFEEARLTRAPVVICVVSSPKESAKIPEWEQILSAGA